jgi:LacI family transcriptional regulator
MARSSPTVRKVADHAGVSIATVSRVTRRPDLVASETRERVERAISELGYRPSHFGQALVDRRHSAIGVVFPGLSGPYYYDVIQGFEAEAIAARLSVLILGTHHVRNDEQVLDMATRVDGIAILGGTAKGETIRALVHHGMPLALLAQHPVDEVPAVRVDNVTAMEDLTGHLLDAHDLRSITFLGDPSNSPDLTERWNGFIAAHRARGRTPPAGPVKSGLDQPSGLRAVANLLASPDPPRAIVCANDEIALGAYAAAAAAGVRIPDDLALTGFDDIPMAGLLSPGLTTVAQPMRELGARVARLLLAQIRGDPPSAPDTILPTRLLIRGSCGCRDGPNLPS